MINCQEQSDEEGSLVDFIVHDSGEDLSDYDYNTQDENEDDENESEGSGVEDDEDDEKSTGESEDASVMSGDVAGDTSACNDAEGTGELVVDINPMATIYDDRTELIEIQQQYTADMEGLGLVMAGGVRRSSRINKGRPPDRYVDSEYCELMLEDTTDAELLDLACEDDQTDEDETEDDDNDDNEDEYDDDESEDGGSVLAPKVKRQCLREE